jgi:hypothetical protein
MPGPMRSPRRRSWLFAAAALTLCGCSSSPAPSVRGAGAQTLSGELPSGEVPLLKVELADGRSRQFTRSELQKLPPERASAQLRGSDPFEAVGVSVTTLLRETGLDLSTNLGGGRVVGQALLARAGDGYRAVFGLADADPRFGHPPLLVVWANADGTPLPDRSGPLQLIVVGERRPGRWVRQLQSLEVKNLP